MKSSATAFLGFLLALTVALASCGAGDEGAGSSISYTGVEDQATLTTENALEIAVTAYQGGSAGAALGEIRALESAGGDGVGEGDGGAALSGRARLLELTRVLKEAVSKIDLAGSTEVKGFRSDVVYGDCSGSSGSASYSIAYDDFFGDFSGDIFFSAFCSEGVTISGSANFSGGVDPATGGFIFYTIDVDSLTMTSGSDSFVASGEVDYDFTFSPTTVTMNMYLEDAASRVFWFRNVTMTLTESSIYLYAYISGGRFYHPDHGYVTLATPDPLAYYYGEDWAFGGELDCGGAGGTDASLTVISQDEYQVQADTVGDGSIGYDSGVLFWSGI